MGQAYNPNVAVQPTVAPPMPQSLKCSSCGGPMKPSGGLALVVCEYCGAVTTMGAGGAAEIIQKHFMLDSRISNEQALDAGGKWLNKGVFRRKVAERSELGTVTLKYVPYWVVPTSVVADFQGTKNVGAGAGTGMMAHGDTGARKAAGAALFALSIAAAAANQRSNVHTGPSQPQVVRVRDRIQMQYNIPVVAVRGYSKYQPDDGLRRRRRAGGEGPGAGARAQVHREGGEEARRHARVDPGLPDDVRRRAAARPRLVHGVCAQGQADVHPHRRALRPGDGRRAADLRALVSRGRPADFHPYP